MIELVFTWIAVFLAIGGTIEVARKHTDSLRANCCYAIANTILFIVFFLAGNWAMVVQYTVFFSITCYGVKQHWKNLQS